MAFFRSLHKVLPCSVQHRPRHLLTMSSHRFQSTQAIEEETLPFYEHEQYYPVHIGEVFSSRYKVIGKLGYGAYSTVWLCRDLSGHEYMALKISIQLEKFPRKGQVELNIYDHLRNTESSHRGRRYIRPVHDAFEIAGPHGRHQCLVQPPMHLSIFDMLKLNPEPLNAPLLKHTLKLLLDALDFLHTEARLVHTDIKADNLMLNVADQSILDDFERAELESPSPRKMIDSSRSIYTSRSFNKPKNGQYGYPVLCDFGEARLGDVHHTGPFVQPHIYRAPEVTFEMPWGPPVDIWNVGTLIWDIFEGRHLFNHVLDTSGHYDPFKHMAQVYALLGPPPKEFISRSETTAQCFNANGTWIADQFERIPETSLEDRETRLEGDDQTQFLIFIRSMLMWMPEQRKTARELLDDPWLNKDL
ncbi:protein kinase [Aspergillus coremiiformis]|uniref:Protein kinase n=1 Tax=Aspergillus coremiiformis TaxID=138285 RepID=A0A5N6Z3F7_9EURO|nr:protein kinase [Aspergillus coremiiformis]